MAHLQQIRAIFIVVVRYPFKTERRCMLDFGCPSTENENVVDCIFPSGTRELFFFYPYFIIVSPMVLVQRSWGHIIEREECPYSSCHLIQSICLSKSLQNFSSLSKEYTTVTKTRWIRWTTMALQRVFPSPQSLVVLCLQILKCGEFIAKRGSWSLQLHAEIRIIRLSAMILLRVQLARVTSLLKRANNTLELTGRIIAIN